MDAAINSMRVQLETIFGNKDDTDATASVTTWAWEDKEEQVPYTVWVDDGNGGGYYDVQHYTRKYRDLTTVAGTAKIGGGEFGEYVGASPEMMQPVEDATAGEDDVTKYLASSGSGQMAEVLTPFFWSQLQEGVGWAQVELPIYSQKLWDDRDTPLKAPTIRSLVDLGVGGSRCAYWMGRNLEPGGAGSLHRHGCAERPDELGAGTLQLRQKCVVQCTELRDGTAGGFGRKQLAESFRHAYRSGCFHHVDGDGGSNEQHWPKHDKLGNPHPKR
jgi:hypothetical protein